MNREYMKQARGDEPAELVLKHCKVINVFTKTIDTEDIAIAGGVILGTGIYDGKQEIDCTGFYVAPGFIDGHCHIESSMVTPGEYARLVIPNGTTTVIADCHEIANVCGKHGIEYMLDAAQATPLEVYMMIPSCVPATSFETSGATLDASDLLSLKNHDHVLGLGEMMNYPGVIMNDPFVHDKLDAYADRFIDGHAPSVMGKDLNAYILAGVKTDHECTSPLELVDKIKRGMYIHLREGSQTKNVLDLLPAVSDSYLHRLMFCTDDLHPSDILRDGHINHNINLAIENGLDPLSAIQMATINTAECYGLKKIGAIAPGYQADLVFFTDLNKILPQMVFKKGVQVAKGRVPLFEQKIIQDPSVTDTIHANLDTFDYAYHLSFGIVNVIQLVKNNVTTRRHIEEVTLKDGDVVIEEGRDLLKLFVVERHHHTGNVGKALLSGYGLKHAAIALSVAHDSHNIVVVGDNETDVRVALQKIEAMKGGIVLVENGKVYDFLQLEVAGLMTNQPAEHVRDRLERMERRVRELGVFDDIDDPFLSLAFLSLPVIPDLKVTDKGLFDVIDFKLIPLEAEGHQ